MESEPSLDHDDLEALIAKDLAELTKYAGLKDGDFSNSKLIAEHVLPGTRKQEIILYRHLILKNIDSITPEGRREAVPVGANLLPGYPDSSAEARLGQLGRQKGRRVDAEGRNKEKRRPME